MDNALLEKLAYHHKYNKLAFYKPYPYQIEFHNARGLGTDRPATQKALMAANRVGKCVTSQTLIDHPDGTSTRAGDLYKRNEPFPVVSWDGERLVSALAVLPIKKPAEECFRVFLSDGSFFEASPEHRILTTDGWVFLGDTLPHIPQLSNWVSGPLVHVLSVRRLIRRLGDFLGSCVENPRPCDGQPRPSSEIDRAFLPSQVGAQEHNAASCNLDGLGNKYTSSRQRAFARPSSRGVFPRALGLFSRFVCHIFGNTYAPYLGYSLESCQPHAAGGSELLSVRGVGFRQGGQLSLESPVDANRIIACNSVGVQDIYDFTVPEYGNYYSNGFVHHNSYSAAQEIAIYLTGRYPDWWEGHRYGPVQVVCAGLTNDTTKNIIQKELLGDPDDPRSLGTGAIPKECVLETVRKPGVPNAFQAFTVKHEKGVSKCLLMAYEQDWKKFMGITADVVWPDEEPPLEVWAQFLRMTTDKPNSLVMPTFTPEEGVTQVVHQFMNELQEGQALIHATWDDAPHLTEDKKRQILAALPPYQREMRSKGIPLMGAGLVYPISEDEIICDPVDIQPHWPRLAAIDFGSDHPFACVWIAWDRDLDIVYLYDSFRQRRKMISENASEIRKRDSDKLIPVMWPHDGNQADPKSSKTYAQLFREEGVNMWFESFTNPPSVGQKKGDLGVEAGLDHIWERMNSGRFKVFRGQNEWFEEFRMYHRDTDGKIVSLRDDLMSATRYAVQSLRNARVRNMQYTGNINYDDRAIV